MADDDATTAVAESSIRRMGNVNFIAPLRTITQCFTDAVPLGTPPRAPPTLSNFYKHAFLGQVDDIYGLTGKVGDKSARFNRGFWNWAVFPAVNVRDNQHGQQVTVTPYVVIASTQRLEGRSYEVLTNGSGEPGQASIEIDRRYVTLTADTILSIIAAVNSTGHAAVYLDIFPWIDEDSQKLRVAQYRASRPVSFGGAAGVQQVAEGNRLPEQYGAFQVSGVSMGLAIAAALMGAWPFAYTGYLGQVGPDLSVSAASSNGVANTLAGAAVVESIDQVAFKAGWALSSRWPLVVPLTDQYEQPLAPALRNVGVSMLRYFPRLPDPQEGQKRNPQLTFLAQRMGGEAANYRASAISAEQAYGVVGNSQFGFMSFLRNRLFTLQDLETGRSVAESGSFVMCAKTLCGAVLLAAALSSAIRERGDDKWLEGMRPVEKGLIESVAGNKFANITDSKAKRGATRPGGKKSGGQRRKLTEAGKKKRDRLKDKNKDAMALFAREMLGFEQHGKRATRYPAGRSAPAAAAAAVNDGAAAAADAGPPAEAASAAGQFGYHMLNKASGIRSVPYGAKLDAAEYLAPNLFGARAELGVRQREEPVFRSQQDELEWADKIIEQREDALEAQELAGLRTRQSPTSAARMRDLEERIKSASTKNRGAKAVPSSAGSQAARRAAQQELARREEARKALTARRGGN